MFNKTTKKIFILIIIFTCIIINLSTCFADDFSLDEFSDTSSISEAYETSIPVSNELKTYSKNIIAIDRKTSTVLYEKNAYDVTAMASTTKIMTCIVALENSSLDEIVTVSRNAAIVNGSTLGITENMQISMRDLIYGLMLRSGNDCAIAIAEHIGGNVEGFAALMNKKAKELGLENTNFVTPHGLDNDNHYTTAYELALLTHYSLNNKEFKDIVGTKTTSIWFNGYSREISNTNELLGNLNGVYGVKTGFTFNAGRCLVSACNRNNLDIIVVVIGSDTKNIRTTDSRNVINYVYDNYELINTYDVILESFEEYKSYFLENVILEKTTDVPIIEISSVENYTFPLLKNSISNLKTKTFTFSKLSTDISKDTKIGYISLYNNDKLLYSLDINLSNTLNKNTWQYYFINIFKDFFKI